jgi:guanylate kinase
MDQFEKFLVECRRSVIEKYLLDGGRQPICFISYCWGAGPERDLIQSQLKQFKYQLEKLGATVLLDVGDLENNINEFMNRIIDCNFIFLIGTPALKARLNERVEKKNNVQIEFENIRKKVAEDRNCLFALIFQGNGDFDTAMSNTLPVEFLRENGDVLVRDCRHDQRNCRTYIDTLSSDGKRSGEGLGIIPVLYQMSRNDLLVDFSPLRALLCYRLNDNSNILVSDELILFEIKLREYYLNNESEIELNIGDKQTQNVTDLFVNLAIVEEETQRLHERKLLESQNQRLVRPTEADIEAGSQHILGGGFGNMMHLGFLTNARDRLFNRTNRILEGDEEIYSPKEVINAQDLFKSRSVKGKEITPYEIVLLGKAGIGKTTLCRYLACKWSAVPKFWNRSDHEVEFKWVFFLRLKVVANEDSIRIPP